MHFDETPAVAVGGPVSTWTRPGFWQGGAGVAACWLGGARAVAAPLYARAAAGKADAHTLAHLGAVDAALAAAQTTLAAVAADVDADPTTVPAVPNCSPAGPAQWSKPRSVRRSSGPVAHSGLLRCAWTSSMRGGWPTSPSMCGRATPNGIWNDWACSPGRRGDGGARG